MFQRETCAFYLKASFLPAFPPLYTANSVAYRFQPFGPCLHTFHHPTFLRVEYREKDGMKRHLAPAATVHPSPATLTPALSCHTLALLLIQAAIAPSSAVVHARAFSMGVWTRVV